jgi:hypothetical protein
MPKDKGAYVEQYPLAKADKQGVASGTGAKVETGIAVELGVPPMVDNQPGEKQGLGQEKVASDTEKFKLK